MAVIKIGCAGWNYPDWIGPFYPKSLERREQLEFYSRYFNITEINSTFYNLPTQEMVINWRTRVPETFRFSVKVWKRITHNIKDPEIESLLSQFQYRIQPLVDKIDNFLFQFPPWFKYSTLHFDLLQNIFNEIPSQYNIVLEFRDNSWYDMDILSRFQGRKNIIIATVYLEGVSQFYMPNQESYYIRLIGDRSLEVFNRIQRSQTSTLDNLLDVLKKLNKSPNINQIFIIVNNHFTGFSPETVNQIKKNLNLKVNPFSRQKTIMDYY